MLAVWILAATPDLVAAAAASGRPQECMPIVSATGQAVSVWSRARVPALSRYCDLIARAQARLESDPASAEKAAQAAAELLPSRAAHHVILARLALRAGNLEQAIAGFDRALAADRRALDQPAAMRDHALALRRAGKLDRAIATYRVLVPRVGLLPTRSERARVLLEAAHASMAASAAAPSDVALDEALAYLRAVADDPHHELEIDVTLSLALVLDRAGRVAQADTLLSELGREPIEAWEGPGAYLADERDREALHALALERHDQAGALVRWQKYLEGEPSWRRAAEARAARLQRPRPRR